MSTIEKMISHYDFLKTKHDALDKEINSAYSHHIDDHIVSGMKKQKLHLKDQMHQIENQLKR
jgi:uncharacterized protein YdcH (DUF465 family)